MIVGSASSPPTGRIMSKFSNLAIYQEDALRRAPGLIRDPKGLGDSPNGRGID